MPKEKWPRSVVENSIIALAGSFVFIWTGLPESAFAVVFLFIPQGRPSVNI